MVHFYHYFHIHNKLIYLSPTCMSFYANNVTKHMRAIHAVCFMFMAYITESALSLEPTDKTAALDYLAIAAFVQ